MPALSRHFSVTAFDFPGFGLSALPKEPWGVADYERFVASLMQRLGIARAHLLGHSHGGRVSIALAARRPMLVDRLVLVDSAGIRPPRTMALKMRGLIARTARRVLSQRFAGAAGQRSLQALYQRMGMADYADAGPLRATFVKIVNENLTPILSSIAAPCLVIWGDRDEETPVWMGKQLAEEIPDSRLCVLPNAGHFAYLDQPQAFLSSVLKFLNSEADV
jgi:pimeloyl-ACP methyl ester carboxylesterase